MAKINILPAGVYNRIAAGEVVERPYSVVKELVENSIDAGATEITVYIEKGGKSLIRVVDNGCGIERDDLHSAFLPHATSKIAKAEDLNNIFTLGFRGEAVASIAAISRMKITSKVEGAKCYQLVSEGGQLGAITEVVGENGTDVCVEKLFYNTPVRLEFLKTDKAEEADITTFISRFILCRSDIAFTYYVNGKKILQSFGDGAQEAFLSVYGAKVLSQCYKIDAVRNGIRIRGYIGNQNFPKSNKSYQSAFLNGRFVINNTISTAVNMAYAPYFMKRQYPFYCLHIQVPKDIVDVNVHPNKLDVRFQDNRIIYGALHSIISSVLDGNKQALEYIVQDDKTFDPVLQRAQALKASDAQNNVEQKPTQASKSISQGILEQSAAEKPSVEKKSPASVFGFDTFTFEQAQQEIKDSAPLDFKKHEQGVEEKKSSAQSLNVTDITREGGEQKMIRMSAFSEKLPPIPKKQEPEKLLKKFPKLRFERIFIEFNDPDRNPNKKPNETDENVDYFEENKRYLAEMDAKAKQNRVDVSSCRYAGKLFNTYVLYERADEVYIIDQHAAHERLIFNRLKEQMQNRNVPTQAMLVPFELKLNAFEGVFIRERLDDIRAMGFEISEAEENTFNVYSVPLDLQNIDLKKFFNEILGDVGGYRAIKLEDILKDKLASAACKAAVKGGMDLTEAEIEALFVLMDGDMGLKCPHGRPVVVKMTKTQLEKMFKRIV